MKYKVGDLIKSKVTEYDVKKGGVYKVIGAREYSVDVIDDVNEHWNLSNGDVEPNPVKTLDNLGVGDVIVGESNRECDVIGVAGKAVIVWSRFWEKTMVLNADRLEEQGWELKEEPQIKEMTVAEVSKALGYEVKIVKEK